MIPVDYTSYALKELNRIIPSEIIIGSLDLYLAPEKLENKYINNKSDIDKYFMHLSSVSSKKVLKQLTQDMSEYDATMELTVIAAKIILSIHEFSKVNVLEASGVYSSEKANWLSYLYYR